ncbi:unnamed protein product (macronuclear) [Paramecium tetraurelia]|uniref:Transmembrane protein n=1 Tax=Paramecium tetraurelia TaxID=5888 RepID=A0CUU4_PARTE|nr:uncharacterized protein GSPATT00039015001 [Paramecium tetraurelia]CAK74561.1 unnamed protein product [Paramecium tetraurelia]|eukprot:XP_001441958.1 hypothetical protein (macronuclear) [Paramecium tetraurelia strain d4-2]
MGFQKFSNIITFFEKCDVEIEKIDNQTTQLYCKCQSFGHLYLIKVSNNSMNQSNNTVVNWMAEEQQKIDIYEQSFLLVQGVFIISSAIVYLSLVFLEYHKSKEIIIEQGQDMDNKLEPAKDALQIRLYPSHFIMFKTNFQYIHSILQLCQDDENPVKKSFRFLQISNEISILILSSTWEILFTNIVIINAFISLLIILVFRVISKITQAIYMFEGKIGIMIILLYLFLPVMYFFLMILAFNSIIEMNQNFIDVQIALNLLSALLLVYFVFEPIAIYLRIVIYRPLFESIRKNEFNPINHFFYFFIYDSKINQTYDQLNI